MFAEGDEAVGVPPATPEGPLSPGGGLWVGRLAQRPSLTAPPLAWQLNEVYRQVAGAHKLQHTKFRWVLGA